MTVKAIYENGVFKPREPVNLEEHTEVEVLIPAPATTDADDPTGWKAAEAQARVYRLATARRAANDMSGSSELSTKSNERTVDSSWSGRPAPVSPHSAAERWAAHVLKACESDGDLRTIDEWASFVGLSRSSLCESCRVLGIRPHDARDFTRILRVVLKIPATHFRPEAFLDVRDRRTLKTLLLRAGLSVEPETRLVSVSQFVKGQRFISADNDGLASLCGFINAELLRRR
jgi:hypothetical protein